MPRVLCSRCVEYLLRNGAEPGANDQQGHCAVHYASAYGRTLCLELVGAPTQIHNRRHADLLVPVSYSGLLCFIVPDGQ